MAATASATAAHSSLTEEDSTYVVSTSHDLKPLANQTSAAPPHSQGLETLPPPAPSPLLLLNSIAGLRDLSASISVFLQRYDDLHNHLESIKAAISAKMPPENPPIPQPSMPPPKSEIVEEKVVKKPREDKSRSKSEIESLCSTMCSRGVRKYMVTHLGNLEKLREEVPKALRQAPNPLKLVLDCFGKFFLQGSKAYTKNSPMIPGREASILVLECFVLMMGLDGNSEKYNAMLETDKTLKEEADVAALAWRKRLVAEGGLAKASQIDARGLLFFVACFGMPAMFRVEDIRDLVIAANAKEIVGVLQKSHVFMSKIAEMVEEMMKKKMAVDAVDMVYTFGLEESFNPQTILISFLKESNETSQKPKQGSPATLNEANKKQLATFKSIGKCLERHGVDPVQLLPEWQISEKITTLEKDVTDFDRKSGDNTAQKRKSSETETSNRPNPKAQEAKRPRHVGHGPHQQRAAGHANNRRNLLDRGIPKHPNGGSASAVVYGGPGAGLLPENMIPAGVGASSSHGGIVPTYSVHEGVMVDPAGQLINHGTQPYAWHRDSAINGRYSQPPPVGLTALYRPPSTSIEGFPGNTASSGVPGNPGSVSDIYHFADSVVESELYQSSVPRSVPAGSSAVPAHYSPYPYQP